MPNITISDQEFREMPNELQQLLKQYLDSKFSIEPHRPLRLELMPSASIVPIELALAVLKNLKPESVEILEQCMAGILRAQLAGFLARQKAEGKCEEEIEGNIQRFENKINPVIGAINRRFSHRFDKRLYSLSEIKLISPKLNAAKMSVSGSKEAASFGNHLYQLQKTHITPFKIALTAIAQGVDLETSDYEVKLGSAGTFQLSRNSFNEFINGKGRLSLPAHSNETTSDFVSNELDASLTLEEPIIVHSSGQTLSVTHSEQTVIVWQTLRNATDQKAASIGSDDIDQWIGEISFKPI